MGSGEKPPGIDSIHKIPFSDLLIFPPNISPTNFSHSLSGYYVVRPGGLFPAPLPQDSALCQKVTQLFWVLGVFLAKTLQDARLVDLPLSPAFLKLLCGGEVSGMVRDSSDIVTRYS